MPLRDEIVTLCYIFPIQRIVTLFGKRKEMFRKCLRLMIASNSVETLRLILEDIKEVQ